MNYITAVIFSFSITIAAIIGWIRFKKISPAYYPFIYLIWIGLLNEIISFIVAQHGHPNTLNNNIYALIESLLITWQFREWGLFNRLKSAFLIIVFLLSLAWIVDHFFVSEITSSTFYFRIFYSFIIVLMSINILNRLIVSERKNILKNSIFLICISFVIYYTYYVLVMTFLLYGLGLSYSFMFKIASFLPYTNLLSNLIYAIAILWMPAKQRFTLPS